MSEFRVSPWKRWGHDRLYVVLPDDTNVAYYDRKTGQLTVLVDGYRDAALEALAPYLTSPRPSAMTPRVDPLNSGNDLATNRPGDGVREKLATEAPGKLVRLLAKLLRRPTEWDSWESGLKGEVRVGRELQRLTSHGWRVLHSIPLPNGVDIDHLLIGPGGVFTINTKRHPDGHVWVGDHVVKINHGESRHYQRKARAEAERARKVLEPRCAFSVPVEPMLVFVAVARLHKEPTLLDVRVYEDRQVPSLRSLSGVLTAAQIEKIYDVARDRRNWPSA
ncbi:nuclease-related domain-containing protein [Streptomyces sp. NPDC054796]